MTPEKYAVAGRTMEMIDYLKDTHRAWDALQNVQLGSLAISSPGGAVIRAAIPDFLAEDVSIFIAEMCSKIDQEIETLNKYFAQL